MCFMECPYCGATMNRDGRFTYECPDCGYSIWDDGDDDEED